MKTLKRIPLGIINIAATPHSDNGSTYVDLLNASYELGLAAQIRADEFAMLAQCVQIDPRDPLVGLTGEVHKFTEISKDWENVENRKPASEEDLKLIQIPKNLKPNRESFRFFLFPKEHRFVFQLQGAKRSISHGGMQKVLTGLFNHESIKKKFPLVSVIVEQEPEIIDQIFRIPHLYKLFIHVERPNPDGMAPGDIEFVEDLLAKQNAEYLDITLQHAPGVSLIPNEYNHRLARVAATSYGRVIAKGRNEQNRPVEIDTSEHPIKEPFDYNTKAKVTLYDQMLAAARALVQRIVKRPVPKSHQPSDE